MVSPRPRIALLPCSTPEGEPRAALAARGLALELCEFLKPGGEVVLLTGTMMDDDGRKRDLVSFNEPLDAEAVSEIVRLADDLEGVSCVISGSLSLYADSLSVTLVVLDEAGGFSRGEASCTARQGALARELGPMFAETAKLAGVNLAADYQPGTENLEAWLGLLETRAHKLACELGALDTGARPYEPALRALKLDRAFTRARDRLGELCLACVIERGMKPEPALEALDTAVRIAGNDWLSVRARAHLCSAMGRHEEAGRLFARLVKSDTQAPDNEDRWRAALNSGRAFNLARLHEAATRMLRIAMEFAPQKAEAVLECARASLGLGENAVAERLLRRAVDLNPKLTVARLHLANLFSRTNRPGEACDQYLAMLAEPELAREIYIEAAEFMHGHGLNDTFERVARRFAQDHATEPLAHLLLATALNAQGRHEDARRALDQAELCTGVDQHRDILQRQRRHAEHPEIEARLKQAAELALGDDPKAGEARFAELLKDHPDFWEVRLLRGIVLTRLDRMAEARSELESVRAGRVSVEAEKQLTLVYARQGETVLALDAARRAYAAAPDDAVTASNLAAALMDSNELAEATKYARIAMTLSPGDETCRQLLEQIESRYSRRGLLGNLVAGARYLTRFFTRRGK
jgi:tetratricopeptide (TPR) repeat protein